jgi:hypothetical protein
LTVSATATSRSGAHRHRRQRAGADPLGCKDRADTSDLALAAQPLEQPQDSASQQRRGARPSFGEGCRAERKVALEIVQQAKIERLVGHRDLKTPFAARGW